MIKRKDAKVAKDAKSMSENTRSSACFTTAPKGVWSFFTMKFFALFATFASLR